jgi:nucleotide-binding universal stress UspA family protein
MAMQRYLLVLDTDLPGLSEELDLEPINYLAARPEQERGEVVVLSVAASRPEKLSPLELLLGAATAHGQSAPAKYPTAPQPGHHVHAAAEQRLNLTVRHLKAIGYRASGLISDRELVEAVRTETRAHDYDEVIVATGRHGGSWLARGLHLDPIHQLRRRWGQRLVTFAPGPVTKPNQRQQQ